MHQVDRSEPPPSFWVPLIVTGAAMFVFAIDAGLLSLVLPEIEDTFSDASRAAVSWVGTGYAVAGVASLLIGGRLGDRYGRVRIFRIGMFGFAAGSAIAGFAPNIGWLLFGRVIAGAFGALYTAVGLAIALREVPDNRKAVAVGFWGFIGSIGFVLGPVGGGALIAVWSWRAAFVAMVPIAGAAGIVAGRVLHESVGPNDAGPVPLFDAVLAACGVGSVAIALSQSGRWGWSDPRTPALFLVGVVLLAALVRVSDRPGALLDRRLWLQRGYVVATAGAGVQQLGFLAWWVATGFVLRGVWNWSVLETGYALSLGMVVGGLSGLAGGRLASRFGYVGTSVAGSIIAGAGPLIWVTRMDASPDLWTTYLPGLFVFMLGAGMAGILPTGAALQGIPDDLLGAANATHSTVRRLGASIGLALMAALIGEGSGAELLDGSKKVFVMVSVAHLGLAPFMIWYGRIMQRQPISTTAT